MPSAISISLPIASRKAAFDFYRNAFGFEAVGEPADDGIPEPLQFALDANTRLMLVPADGLEWVIGKGRIAAAGRSECLLSVGAASPAEVRALFDRCVAAGASVRAEPGRKPWGFDAIVADPDGHLWMIVAGAG